MTAKRKESHPQNRLVFGRSRGGEAQFPVAPPKAGLPRDYAQALETIKRRIRQERLRVVLSANSAMVLLYWDIGQFILERQKKSGWGARVIDRMTHDLHAAFPDMQGFSPRNLKYMRAFSVAWKDRSIVQQLAAQIPWFHNCLLLDRIDNLEERIWYIHKTIENGWSRAILDLQIDNQTFQRAGKAVTNFPKALPPTRSDMAAQVFKDPYLFNPQDDCRSPFGNAN